MLSRVADSLYWMSRYLERAEHTARLLDENFNLMLDESSPSAAGRWIRVLHLLGNPADLYRDGDPYALARRLSLDLSCQSSIIWCITAARENARQVREQISSEQWQRLNILYHHVTQTRVDDLQAPPAELLQSVIEGVQFFHGASEATMLHGEGWHFIATGRFLERAFGAVSLLDVYTAEFWSHTDGHHPEGHEYLEWIGLLRASSAFEAFCKVYTADITPDRILEFLLLHKEFPHSVRFSIESVREALDFIQQHRGSRRSAPLDRVSGRLTAMLCYADLNEILTTGVGPFLREILRLCNEVQQLIYRLFIDYSVESALAG